MPTIKVNGETVIYKVSPYRSKCSIAYYKRNMLDAFAKIGIKPPFLDLTFGGGMGYTSDDGWAEVSWIVNNQDFKYRCDSQPRSVDNVAAIAQMIEADSKAIRRGLKTFGQVMNQFKIGYDESGTKIQTPREIIGIPADIKDLEYIKYKYKSKAKELHPDAGGNAEDFKQLNEAYKQIETELKDGN